jgi:uncharacterized protein
MISPVKVWRNQKHIAILLGKIGTISTWTMIRVPPDGYGDQAPYPVVVVELSDGMKITAQMVDWEKKQLHIGQHVCCIIRRVVKPSDDGVIPYGIKVKPIEV